MGGAGATGRGAESWERVESQRSRSERGEADD